jgi:hypothetical protein
MRSIPLDTGHQDPRKEGLVFVLQAYVAETVDAAQ